MENKKTLFILFQTFKPYIPNLYIHIYSHQVYRVCIYRGLVYPFYSPPFWAAIDKPLYVWYGGRGVSLCEMVCLTIWTGLRKSALIRVSKPLYPCMSTMSTSYSNSLIVLMFDYLYRYCTVYSMVIDCLLHWSRQDLQVVCDQPHLLDYHSNGMSNWLPQGLSFCSVCILRWRMVNPSYNPSQSAASLISTSAFFAVPNIRGSLWSNLSHLFQTSLYSSQLKATSPIFTRSRRCAAQHQPQS